MVVRDGAFLAFLEFSASEGFGAADVLYVRTHSV